MFNSVPHSTTKWSPASPKRENQSSLYTFVRLSPMCLYYLRSASLQALTTLRGRHPSPPPSPLPPILRQPTSPPARLHSSSTLYTRRVRCLLCFRTWSRQTVQGMFLAGGNPLEFHFVCQANYTPGFYIRGCRYFTVGQRGAYIYIYSFLVVCTLLALLSVGEKSVRSRLSFPLHRVPGASYNRRQLCANKRAHVRNSYVPRRLPYRAPKWQAGKFVIIQTLRSFLSARN